MNFLTPPLTQLINSIIVSSEIPDHFKKAEIVPIYKTNKKDIISNYRPISLISNLAKIFEKVLHVRLIKFIEKNKLLNKKQFGFRKDMSTNDALQLFSDSIFENLDSSKPTIAVFLDLAKAFDTVDYNKLFMKLEKIGIRGMALNLIKNYLTNRKQVVKLEEVYSDELVVRIGIPQGTILGPLFFVIFVNDLLSLDPNAQVMSYADDTAITMTEGTWLGLENRANNVINNVANWLRENGLSLNIEKTKYILFSTYKDKAPDKLNIVIHDDGCNMSSCTCRELGKEQFIKYLGIFVDCNMNFKEHIEQLKRKLRYLLFVFSNLRSFLNAKTLICIYYALFESKATYGIISWGSAYGNVINSLQSIQNRIVGLIFRKSSAQLDQCYKKNNLLKIRQIYYLKAITTNHYKNLKSEYLHTKQITRKKSIPVMKTKLEVGKKCTKWIAIKLYNLLDDDLKNYNFSTKALKKKIKSWICQKNLEIKIFT